MRTVNVKWAFLAIVLLSFLAWFIFSSHENRQTADLARQLATKQHTERPLKQSSPDLLRSELSIALDRLQDEGIGMPVPDHLVVNKVQEQGYWFVGKREDGGGVEIPFAPGSLPKPMPDLDRFNENPGFVGPTACQPCHQEHYQKCLHTMHYQTSRKIEPGSVVKGRFEPGDNLVATKDENLRFEMLHRDGQYYQRTYFYDWAFDVPMHISVGASIIGQSYFYWHGDQLYQANVTRVEQDDRWVNSPGYLDGDAAHARPIGRHCFSCHGTYHDFRGPPNHYTPDEMIYGITCERCHGPGAEHVKFHTENPEEKVSHAMVVISKLDRDKQVDVCGQCHLGRVSPKGRAFRYRPGDEFFDFYEMRSESSAGITQVHGANQLARLKQSQCYIKSEMGCVDCHDPHQNEHRQMELFSQRCMECHEKQACGMHDQVDFDVAQNCIECHMPNRPTERFVMRSVDGDVFPPLRDHFIKVDLEATSEFLEQRSK